MKIKVGDKFDKIVDVMNGVFGWNYKSCFHGFYYLNDEKEYGAWFPKLAKGTKEPGDTWYGWVNILSSDGKYIYMKNYSNPEMMSLDDFYPLSFTFAKNPGGTYEFLGVYKRTHFDPELGFVNERVMEDVDTDEFPLIPKIISR